MPCATGQVPGNTPPSNGTDPTNGGQNGGNQPTNGTNGDGDSLLNTRTLGIMAAGIGTAYIITQGGDN